MLLHNPFTSRTHSLNEVVFANRNKSYGAYELRTRYTLHINQSLLITSAITVLAFLICFYLNRQEVIEHQVASISNKHDEMVLTHFDVEKPQPKHPVQKSFSSLLSYIVARDSSVTSNDSILQVSTREFTNTGFIGDTVGSHNRIASGTKEKSFQEDSMSVIHLMPGVMPEFPGGMNALMNYLAKNIHCDSWKKHGTSGGKIVFSMIIRSDGHVSDVELIRDEVGFQCQNEVKNIIENMPAWKPGMQGKRAVHVKYILPVWFEKE